jgi:DNA-binding MarR family transcriptional regulator
MLVSTNSSPPVQISPAAGEQDVAAVDAAAAAFVAVWGRSRRSLNNRVSPIQMQALLVVEKYETVNLNRLSNALDALPSSTSRLCDRLEAAGLLHRQIAAQDRRELTLSLTRQGRDLLTEYRQSRQADLARVLAELPSADRKALLRGLEAFAAAAATSGGEDADHWSSLAARLLG